MSEPSTVTRHLPVQMSHTKNRGACTCAISFWLHPSAAATHLTEHEKKSLEYKNMFKKTCITVPSYAPTRPKYCWSIWPILKQLFNVSPGKKTKKNEFSISPIYQSGLDIKSPKETCRKPIFPPCPNLQTMTFVQSNDQAAATTQLELCLSRVDVAIMQ